MAVEQKNKVAKVQGVLQGNSDVREIMLRRIYWKDKTYTDFGDGLLKYRPEETRDVKPLTDGKSLLDYTHDGTTTLSASIRKKYGTADAEAYEVSLLPQELRKWVGDYRDIFDPHNRLGQVGDVKFAEEMTFANYANFDRFIEQKYITPKLIGFYGSNPSIEGDNKFKTTFNQVKGKYNPDGGRIPDIPEANVGIEEYIYGDEENNGIANYYREKQFGSTENYDRYKPGDAEAYAKAAEFKSLGPGYIKGQFNPYSPSYGKNLLSTILQPEKIAYDISYDERDSVTDKERTSIFSPAFTNNGKIDVTGTTTFETLSGYEGNDLLTKTNDLFRRHKIATLVGRFHTTLNDNNGITDKWEFTDTAKSKGYGNSHGRNLLRKNAGQENDNVNGYNDPYCRVWTYHHQYDKVNRLIRPFIDDKGNSVKLSDIQAMNDSIRAHNFAHVGYQVGEDALRGGDYLADNTVLNSNGFVNIAPSKEDKVEIKKCMFSIENLAWKDVIKRQENISAEQTGPNGGRIMWFPPYDLNFQENVNVDWDSNSFIGRGEKVYTYKNTDRTGTLSFSLLIDHPGIIDVIKNNSETDTSHEDILRFFAGCQLLEAKDAKASKDIDIEKDNNSDEPKETTPKDKVYKIKFYVYFPNNYSGNHTKTTEIKWQQNGSSDDDWYKYLLFGRGTEWDKSNNRGYEINNVYGLGDSTNTIRANVTDKTHCTQWIEREELDPDTNRAYHYRVDFDLRQVLKSNNNYKDTASFRLNSVLDSSVSKGANFSFTEVFVALLKSNPQNLIDAGLTQTDLDRLSEYAIIASRQALVQQLAEVFSGASSISRVEVKGAATAQDSKPRSGCSETNATMLARRRARSVGKLLEGMLINRVPSEDAIYNDTNIEALDDMTGVNTKEAKAQRYAVAEIWINAPEISKLSEANNTDNVTNATNNEPPQLEEDEYYDKQLDPASIVTDSKIANMSDFIVEKAPDITEIRSGDRVIGSLTSAVTRYETEAEYFKKLAEGDSYVFKSLKQKFQYFTPAFHSISPEGFNARLTFLHQCTRQGHTIEASDRNGYAMTAGNLSFGRMPVCVLRIGDFLNTRIIINSMSIDYGGDGMQWDLNPEGAGVQPMYAKVSLAITIIGGQSLEGPINRLQNAVSFDYYANAGVYDDRADRVQITTDSENRVSEEYTHLWTPHPTY